MSPASQLSALVEVAWQAPFLLSRENCTSLVDPAKLERKIVMILNLAATKSNVDSSVFFFPQESTLCIHSEDFKTQNNQEIVRIIPF